MTPARFCSYCGKPLGHGARFCGACGKPVPVLPAEPAAPAAPAATAAPARPAVPAVVPPPPAPAPQAATPPAQQPVQAAPQATAEPILGIIPWVMRKSGMMGLKVENFTLIVTPRRLIFALLTNQARGQNVQRAQQEAKAAGKNAFQQLQARMNADNGAYYFQMTPDMALAENPANFFILNQQVLSAKISSYGDDDSGVTTYHLHLEGGFGKLKFELGRCDERGSKQVLRQALGAAMR